MPADALPSLHWSLPPPTLNLAKREVHVWLVPIGNDVSDIEYLASLLSAAEQVRASKFKFQRDQRRYVVAHAALRSILCTYLAQPIANLEFFTGPNGKPKFSVPPAKSEFEFNLSHSHEVALIAVTRGIEIGIDVEWINERFVFHEVAQRFFTAREVAALSALPGRLQRVAFYKCWTSKEAFLKAKGTGLSGALDEVQIELIEGMVVRIKGITPGWSLREVIPIEDYAAALVVEGRELEPKYYKWDGFSS